MYPSGRSRALGWGLVAAWLAAALAVAASLSFAASLDWRAFLTLAALALSGVALLHAWQGRARGCLAWDGHGWRWEGKQPSRGFLAPVVVKAPDVLLDFQGALLLKLEAMDCRVAWCVWLERESAQPLWLDLRRALYARRSAVKAPSAVAQAADTRPAPV